MTQKDKELLLKDLCARLDTNLVCSIYRIDDYGVGYRDEILSGYCKGDIWDEFYFGDDCGIGIDNVSKIKPYLIPLSKMTEEQKKYINDRWGVNENFDFEIDPNWGKFFVELGDVVGFINWCYENHFDINGLIPRGLAEDATDKNIY
jgi:hypothetical protein